MSKALEALDSLFQSCNYGLDYTYDDAVNDKNIILKHLKALEIIKEKRVDLKVFYEVLGFEGNADLYNKYFHLQSYRHLTQDEFDILNKAFGNE